MSTKNTGVEYLSKKEFNKLASDIPELIRVTALISEGKIVVGKNPSSKKEKQKKNIVGKTMNRGIVDGMITESEYGRLAIDNIKEYIRVHELVISGEVKVVKNVLIATKKRIIKEKILDARNFIEIVLNGGEGKISLSSFNNNKVGLQSAIYALGIETLLEDKETFIIRYEELKKNRGLLSQKIDYEATVLEHGMIKVSSKGTGSEGC